MVEMNILGQVADSEVVDSQIEGAEVAVEESDNVAEEKTVAKRDPLAKYNELSTDAQTSVDDIVKDVIAKIGGADNINLSMLLGILDKLNAEKKSAKEADKQNAKERKEAEKEMQKAQGEIIKDKVQVKDTIDYAMATYKCTILQASVIKVTDKSVRIEVTADTKVLYKGNEMTAGNVPGLRDKLGAKSVAFGKIKNLTRDGVAISLAK